MEHENAKSSIRAAIVRDMIARMSADRVLGPKLQKGEIRKNMVEPPWKCPACFNMTQITLAGCRAELLSPVENPDMERIVLQLHGGGYIGAMRNIYRSFAGLYSELGKGISVLVPDYRVAPEHPYPAALEDHGMELPEGLVLMSPWTDLTASGESYETNYTLDPLFGNTRDSMLYNLDYAGDEDPANPYISPLFGDFAGFPPMLVQAGSIEMLLCDSTRLAQKAREAGVKVRISIYEEMFHVFQMAELMLPESKQAWEEVGKFLRVLDRLRREALGTLEEEALYGKKDTPFL